MSSDILANTRSRIEPLSCVAVATSCERPKVSAMSSSLNTASSGVSRMPKLKSPTMRRRSFVKAVSSSRDENSSLKTACDVFGGLYTTRSQIDFG